MKAEGRMMFLQTKEHQGSPANPQKLGRGRNRLSLMASGGTRTLILDF